MYDLLCGLYIQDTEKVQKPYYYDIQWQRHGTLYARGMTILWPQLRLIID